MWRVNALNVGDGGSGFHNGTEVYHQAVRAWKALVEIADNEGVAPFVAGWAKARINPLDPGAAIRPAPSARPEVERLSALWSKFVAALNQKLGKSDFPLETVDASALHQVPGVHVCHFPFLGLHLEKLGFTTAYHRIRCAYGRLKRLVPDELRMVVGPTQHPRSLPNRSSGKVVLPQLPSGSWFMFRSCRLLATSACGISHSRTALRFAQQSPLTRGQGVKMITAPMNR
jgi:hypothetical protein